MKLRPVKPDVDFPALEERVLEHWDATDAFRRSIEERSPAERYAFYDGPPFATGLPHYGHLVASVLKDIVPRYWTMLGRRVERRWGWDCHGLPVENEAQKELGITTTAEIEALGVARFNEVCRGLVLRYTSEWRRTIRRLGRWVDHDRGYRTMDTDFMESVWWAFHELWQKGLIYEGFRVQPVSPRLGTPLSNFEVALGPQERDPVTKKDGHRRRQDPSITVRFQLEDEPASLWAWTTTPWTLPSNLALAVNPSVEYARVQVEATGEVAYVEPGRLADYQARKRVGPTRELGRVRGSELVGRAYSPLFPYFSHLALDADGVRRAFKVVGAAYVGVDSGTGIVHQAPAFGEDDFQVGQAEGLPLVRPVSLAGEFTDEIPEYAGQYVKDNVAILRLIKVNPMRLRLEVPESAANTVKVGTPLRFSTDAAPGATFEAVVRELNPSLDSRNRTLTAEARLVKADPRLRPGMFVQVNLTTDRAARIVTVPRQAIYSVAGLTKVCKIENGVARRVTVTPGLAENDWVEVPGDALKDGDRVAISELATLTDGAKVRQ